MLAVRELCLVYLRTKKTEIQVGDEVIVHHNVFRRWYNQHGIESNSRSYYKDDLYFVRSEQIFLYKRNNEWNAPKGFCFVKPIKSTDILNNDKEQALKGIIKHIDKDISSLIDKEDLVGFTPNSEYEFIVDGERMYRVFTNSISIKYERQGNEKEYNPSWT